jgi:hypothetical protein
MCRFPVPNFAEFGQEVWNLRAEDSVASITQMFTKLAILQWR